MSIQINSIFLNNDPIDYVADDNLIKAVEIAIALGKPLLVSGEPGTGKTKLADYVAKQLSLQTEGQPNSFIDKPFVFNTKSTSVSSDLFYFYDAISHFRSQKAEIKTEQFIELRPMGLAIAQTYGYGNDALQQSLVNIRNYNEAHIKNQPHSSVVLIDEVDKAPREFPNDLLNEMENYQFEIKEINQSVKRAANDSRILVIMTSNSEKNLPNAFLRRCVFYHIEFPDNTKLLEIAKKRLTIKNTEYDELIAKVIDEFNNIRNLSVNKKPSTSEFLDWVNLLRYYGLLNNPKFYESVKDGSALYESTKSALIKNSEDLQVIKSKTAK